MCDVLPYKRLGCEHYSAFMAIKIVGSNVSWGSIKGLGLGKGEIPKYCFVTIKTFRPNGSTGFHDNLDVIIPGEAGTGILVIN